MANSALSHLGAALTGRNGDPMGSATMAIIHLHEALQSSHHLDQRIKDRGPDIFETGNEKDLTSLIANARNAACHIHSPLHKVDDFGNGFSFNILTGKIKSRIDNNVFSCDHANDAAIFFGKLRIYVRRNLFLAAWRVNALIDADTQPKRA